MVITQGAGSIGNVARDLAEHELLHIDNSKQVNPVGEQ
jgi:hypothetical protein